MGFVNHITKQKGGGATSYPLSAIMDLKPLNYASS